MILIYTGEGKGKTSACAGQALRALGQGMRVVFAQFMKRDGAAGEQRMLRRLLGDDFRAGGLGFLRTQEAFPEHRQAALALMDWVEQKGPRAQMVVLDEALYALRAGVITQEELQKLMAPYAGPGEPHIALSGRGLPDWLREAAHLVTEMREIRHPLRHGHAAVKGIEF